MTYSERIKYAFQNVGEGKPALIILDYYSMIATEIKVNSAIILLKLVENIVSFVSITWPNSAFDDISLCYVIKIGIWIFKIKE